MEELPVGSVFTAGASVPIVTGDGQLETAISLLILVFIEWFRSYLRKGDDK